MAQSKGVSGEGYRYLVTIFRFADGRSFFGAQIDTTSNGSVNWLL